MRLEFNKELFYKEIERKEVVQQRIQWSVSILVILIGSVLYCLNTMFKLEEIQWAMALILGCSGLSLLLAAVCICIPLWAKKTTHMPMPSQMDAHYSTLKEHYSSYEGSQELAENAFTDYLAKTYIECADENIKVNDKKMHFLSIANTIMIIGFIFLLLTFAILIPEMANI